jgi:Phospholipase_D-nuclease N-terminal
MVIAADYPFMDVLWTMVIFFAWVVWIWMMIFILTDVFRRSDIGGWAKAAWVVFMIVLPFLGVLAYLIAQHDGITQRNLDRAADAQKAFDERVQAAAHSGNCAGGAASEIAKAQDLLDHGTIDRAEFDVLKGKALAAG